MPDTTNYQKHQSQNPIQKYLIANFYKEAFRIIKPLKCKKVLDVGCGEGFTLKRLEDQKIGNVLVGVDNSQDAIKIGSKIYPNLDLRIGSIYDLAFKDNEFDLVICNEVLEHLDDPEKALREIRRVSKKYVLVSVPNEPFFILANFIRGKYFRRFGNHPEHINHWTFKGIVKFIEKSGLMVVKKKYPFAWSLVLSKKI